MKSCEIFLDLCFYNPEDEHRAIHIWHLRMPSVLSPPLVELQGCCYELKPSYHNMDTSYIMGFLIIVVVNAIAHGMPIPNMLTDPYSQALEVLELCCCSAGWA